MSALWDFFSQGDFMPHGFCIQWKPALLWTFVASDLAIGLSYLGISIILYRLVRRIRLPFSSAFLAFGIFIAACGINHFISVYTLWEPYYGVEAFFKVITALASAITAIYCVRLSPKIYEVSEVIRSANEKAISIEEARKRQTINPVLFKRLLSQNIVLPLALSISLCGIYSLQIFQLLRSNQQVQQATDLVSKGTRVFKLLVDAEMGARGYLITGRKDFIPAFHKASEDLSLALPDLTYAVREEPVQRQHVGEIHRDYESWRLAVSDGIKRKLNGERVDLYIDQPVARGLMRNVRGSFDEFDAYGHKRREQLSRDADQAARTTLFLTLGLSLVAGIVLALFGGQQLHSLSDSYNKVIYSLSQTRDRLEEEVQKRTLALQSANRELEAFSYSVSHDLRAPLRGVDGFSQALLEDYGEKLDGQGQSYLRYIREGVQRMGKLIDDLLSLSRLSRSEMKKKTVDLAAMAQEIIDGFRRLEPNRVVNFINVPVAFVVVDEGLFTSVLENLLGNAWKFTTKVAQPKIEFGFIEKDAKSVFFVRDNGAGFDMRFASNLFGAFQRLHTTQEFEGSGIGLATVKRIILRHGGQIWAESTPGEGATFYFSI